MEQRFLLDTNAVLDYMGNKLPKNAKNLLAQIIDNEINISIINKIELLSFKTVDQDLIDFVNCANIQPLNDSITDKTIEIRQLCKIKLPDAVIAATALINEFTLITRNLKDFKNIPKLKSIDPHTL